MVTLDYLAYETNAADLIRLFFSNTNTKFLKESIFLFAKVHSNLVPPHFRLVPTHLVCSGDGTGTQ